VIIVLNSRHPTDTAFYTVNPAGSKRVKTEMDFQMPLQANQHAVSGRGTMTTIVNDQSGQRAAVFLPNLPEGTPLAKAGASLVVALEGFAGSVRIASAQFLPEVIADHLRAAARNMLARPFVAFQKEAIAFRQVTDKAMAMALTVVPATVATAPIRARAVKQFDEADIASKAKMLQTFDLEKLSGLIEVDALSSVSDDLAQTARDRFVIMAHVARTGLQAQFQRIATANDPLATGADTDAAMAASKESFYDLKARSATVADAANVLRDIMIAVSLSCEITTDAAYALLTGATNAN
jgi:hypothetical protein